MVELHTFRMGPGRALALLMVCHGAMDFIQASALRDLFAELLNQRPEELIMDLSHVSYLDEAVAAEVLHLKERTKESTCRLEVLWGNNLHVRRMLSRNQWFQTQRAGSDACAVS